MSTTVMDRHGIIYFLSVRAKVFCRLEYRHLCRGPSILFLIIGKRLGGIVKMVFATLDGAKLLLTAEAFISYLCAKSDGGRPHSEWEKIRAQGTCTYSVKTQALTHQKLVSLRSQPYGI